MNAADGRDQVYNSSIEVGYDVTYDAACLKTFESAVYCNIREFLQFFQQRRHYVVTCQLSAQKIVNWVTTADGCVHTADTTSRRCVHTADTTTVSSRRRRRCVLDITFSRSIFSQRSSREATFSRRVSMSILVPSIIASVRAISDDGDAPFIALGSESSPLMIRRRRRRLPGPLLPPPGEHLHSPTANIQIPHASKLTSLEVTVLWVLAIALLT